MGDSTCISARCARLNQVFSGKYVSKKASRCFTREALIDAFLALYEQCSEGSMRSNKHIASFVQKYKPMCADLRRLCLNKDDFEVIDTIGRGHFGEVRVVREKHSKDVYAMKTLKKSKQLAQENQAFFEEEREIMAVANSPWITSLQYAFQDVSNLYLVMDYHPGGDLLSLLNARDEVLDEDMARFYLAELVLAIHSLHLLGYVHRDIKPDNVLIDRTGHIKLADFGSSARLSTDDKKVYSQMPVGTPEYISPEVLTATHGSPVGAASYGAECDWWSLGVVAYEMLFGCTPFESSSVLTTYSKIMNHKNSLEFPEEVPISKSAKNLISGLLSDSKSRLGHDGLICHPFFRGIEWNTLQDTVPPYVPNLKSAEDTSHFEEFEPDSPELLIDSIEKYGGPKAPGGFSGKDLPFVGFTFFKPLALPPGSPRKSLLATSPAAAASSTSIQRRLTMKTQELKNALQSCDGLKDERSAMQNMLDDLKAALEHKDKCLTNAEIERDLLEKEKVLYDTQIKDLQRRLDSERTERQKSDSATLKLLSELKETSCRADELRDQERRASVDEQQQIVLQLEQERFIANKRAHRLQEELLTQGKLIEDGKARIAEMQGRLSKMNEEAKRNMDEWQEKLDKVTQDSEARIAELHAKLAKSLQANHEATDLIESVRKSKDELQLAFEELTCRSAVESGSVAREEIDQEELAQRIVDLIWEESRDEGGTLREKYREKCSELKKLQNHMMDIEDQLFKAQRTQKKLEREASSHQKQTDKLQKAEKEVEVLSKYKRQADNTNKKLQEQLDAKKKLLTSSEEETEAWKLKYKTLEEMLKERPNESEKSGDDEVDGRLRLQEKALLMGLQEDKKSLGQKISSLQEELEEWRENNRSLRESLGQREDKLAEVSRDFENKIKGLEVELNKAHCEASDLKNTNKSLEETILKLENEIDTKLLEEEMKVVAKRDALDKQIRDGRLANAGEVQAQLNEMVERRKELLSQNKEYEAKLEKLSEQCSELTTARETLEDGLKEKERTLEGQALTISMLKSTCSMLESQVEELETMNEDKEERMIEMEINRKKNELQTDKMECSLAEAERLTEQEKSAKLLSEERNAKLQEALQDVQSAHIREVDEMNEQLQRQRERADELVQLLNEAEKKLGLTTLEMKTQERKLTEDKNKSEDERKKLQIEVDRLTNTLSVVKATNFELNQTVEQLAERCDELAGGQAALAEQLEVMEASHAEERLKLQATSCQQTKLIDFLQCKSEGQTPKKKRLIGGSKSGRKNPEESKKTLHQQWKELQQGLEKERATCLHLQTELNRTTAELQAAKMEVAHWKSQSHNAATPKPAQTYAVLSALQQSPSNQPSPLKLHKGHVPATPTAPDPATHRPKERMHHNIPHRLVHVLNMRATKCTVCMNTVHFGRQSSKCADCSSICHVKCAASLPRTCGLPDELVEHFSDALHGHKDGDAVSTGQKLSRNSTSRLPGGKLEGWLKVPRLGSVKQGWEKRWMVLNDQTLELFDKENAGGASTPSESLRLCGKDGPVTVHSAVMCSELIGMAATDLPFVLRVESRPRCWPTRNLYLLAPNFREKQRWVTALEAVLGDIRQRSMGDSDQKLLGNVLMHVEGSDHIDINSSKRLNDELVVLLAEEGLFSLSFTNSGKSAPRRLPGVDKAVQLDIVPALGLAIVIAGKERQLWSLDLKQLQARARQTHSSVPLTPLAAQVIEKIKNCHLFAVGQSEGKHFICAATPNKLLLLRFNSGIGSFCLRKEVDTNDPCNCIRFASSSVIYGTDRFYSLDLKQHTVKGFLDPKDTSLAFAVYGASQMNIFPIEVLDVTSQGCSKKEYLLCFNEFGVFVDSSGRQTRTKQLLWTRLSLAFAYSSPFLFVTHFNSIGVCEIPALTSEKPTRFSHKFLEIQNPRILGPAVSPGAVYLVSTLHEEVRMLCFQGSSAAAIAGSGSDEDAGSDEDDIFSELSRLSLSAAPGSPTKLGRSPTWSAGSQKRKTPTAPRARASSFRSGRPFRSARSSTGSPPKFR